MGRQHQGLDRPGVRQVPEGSEEQGKMEKTACKIICGAPTTLAFKGLIMMMMYIYVFASVNLKLKTIQQTFLKRKCQLHIVRKKKRRAKTILDTSPNSERSILPVGQQSQRALTRLQSSYTPSFHFRDGTGPTGTSPVMLCVACHVSLVPETPNETRSTCLASELWVEKATGPREQVEYPLD